MDSFYKELIKFFLHPLLAFGPKNIATLFSGHGPYSWSAAPAPRHKQSQQPAQRIHLVQRIHHAQRIYGQRVEVRPLSGASVD